jgi:hypothetical protein
VQQAAIQTFLDLTDTQKISLAVDHIRKGIQCEDTRKILHVCAAELTADGKGGFTNAAIEREFDEIFNKSKRNEMLLPAPVIESRQNPLYNSEFWDFDIVEPEITIVGDTARVKCEFVLWGARTDDGKVGRRQKGTLIFIRVPIPERPQINDKDFIPASGDGKDGSINATRVWKLAGMGSLLEFLATVVARKASGQ